MYFNRSKNFISYYINCNAGGFPNLNWNHNGVLDSFVPKSQAPLDSVLSFQQHLKYIKTMAGNTAASENLDYDYYIIVYWNRFMGRQSKRMIKYIHHNINAAGDQKIKTYFVNTDNAYFDSALKTAQK